MEQIIGKYKQTDIGVLPTDWDVDLIRNIATIKTGGRNTQDRIEDGEYPFFVRSQTIERINTHSYDGEAVLTAGDGVGVGKVMHYINGKFDCHQRVYRISNFDGRIHGYYFYLYFSNNFLNRIMQMTAKSSVDSVRMDMIANMQIPLPPTKSEQTAIANALSDADNYITSLEKLIAKKRLIKQGAMQELLKPKEGWVELSLGECLIRNPEYGINAPATAYLDTLPTYLRITDISENGKFLSENKVSVNHPLSEHFYLKKGDLVFARTGASVGKTYLYDENDGKLVFAGFLIRVAVNPEKLNPILLKNLTETKKYWDWVKLMSMRSGQPGINGNEYKQFPFYLPSTMEEQNRIATILDDMDTEIVSLGNKLDKAKQIKQGMMQQLLTGRIRLV